MAVTVSVLAAAGLAGGGVALAADSDETPHGQVRFVVEENGTAPGAWDPDDCPEKDGGGTGATTPSAGNPSSAL
jgi:hypothetical protein